MFTRVQLQKQSRIKSNPTFRFRYEALQLAVILLFRFYYYCHYYYCIELREPCLDIGLSLLYMIYFLSFSINTKKKDLSFLTLIHFLHSTFFFWTFLTHFHLGFLKNHWFSKGTNSCGCSFWFSHLCSWICVLCFIALLGLFLILLSYHELYDSKNIPFCFYG